MPTQQPAQPSLESLESSLTLLIIDALEQVQAQAIQTYEQWLQENFPDIAAQPLAPRHKRLWRWFASLTPSPVWLVTGEGAGGEGPAANRQSKIPPEGNERSESGPLTANARSATPRPRVEVWPRGGAKSATAELACAYIATRLTRRFVLYVSATQSQANMHVQTIASLLERLGTTRATSRYGTSKGWRQDQLKTADGFNIAAYGLDGASRGIKIDRYRPDLIIFDDIDNQADTAATVAKKIEAITTALLPAGSPDCAVLFLQNLIHQDGVVAQLVDGRAQFLMNRHVPTIEPAVRNLQVEIVPSAQNLSRPGERSVRDEPGEGPLPSAHQESAHQESAHQPICEPPTANQYRIVAGQATWQGQSIETCEKQINDWGLRAFLREAQHEVENAQGYFFDTSKFEIVDDAPSLQGVCLAWDLAATEGGGDHTVAVLMGRAGSPNTPTPQHPNTQGVFYVLFVLRVQRSSEAVRELILKWSTRVRDRFKNYSIHLPQDPGQAGKSQAESLRRLLAQFRNVRIEPVTGSKSVRASSYAEAVNLGNVKLLRAAWNKEFIEEHRKFREDESHEHDDQVDTASDAFKELSTPRIATQSNYIKTNPTYAAQYSHMRQAGEVEGKEDDDDDW